MKNDVLGGPNVKHDIQSVCSVLCGGTKLKAGEGMLRVDVPLLWEEMQRLHQVTVKTRTLVVMIWLEKRFGRKGALDGQNVEAKTARCVCGLWLVAAQGTHKRWRSNRSIEQKVFWICSASWFEVAVFRIPDILWRILVKVPETSYDRYNIYHMYNTNMSNRTWIGS